MNYKRNKPKRRQWKRGRGYRREGLMAIEKAIKKEFKDEKHLLLKK